MQRVLFNDYVDAAMTAGFIAVVIAMMIAGTISAWRALALPRISTIETDPSLGEAHHA